MEKDIKTCVHMKIEILKSYGIGEEESIDKIFICTEKDENLYLKLLEKNFESSCFSNICPFHSYYPDKIAECPCYKEKSK